MTGPTYTSLVGYREHVLSGKATSQRNQILEALFESAVPLNRRQISKLTRLEINAVCGRVNVLLKSGLIRVTHEDRDPDTEKITEFLWPVMPQPVQRTFENLTEGL